MSKTVKSPVVRFPGTVDFYDPLSFPQSIAFSDALDKASALETKTRADLYEFVKAMLPGIAACVESCDIDGVVLEPDKFPSTPNVSAQDLLAWLVQEVLALYRETEPPDPNE